MKKIVSVILIFAMCLTQAPTALAEDEPPYQFVNVTSWTTGDNPEPEAVEFGGEDLNTIAAYIDEPYELTEPLDNYYIIINDADVLIGEGGSVDTGKLFIFGDGSLDYGGVVFIAGHDNEITATGDGGVMTANDVLGACMANGSDALNISGEFGNGTEEEQISIKNASIPNGSTLTLGSKAFLGISDCLDVSGSLIVNAGATLAPAQHACITARAGASFTGIIFYSEDAETVWTDYDFEEEELFVWLANDERGDPLQKWVRFVHDPGGDELHDYDYRVIYDQDVGSILIPEEGPSLVYAGDGWRGNFGINEPTEPGEITLVLDPTVRFPESEHIDDPITVDATIRVRYENGTYDNDNPIFFDKYVVEANEVKQDYEGYYSFVDNVFSFTPASATPVEIFVYWTPYHLLQPDEGEIAVEINIEGSVTATVELTSLSSEEYQTSSLGSRTKYILDKDTEPLTLKITPGVNEHLNDLFVGWNNLSDEDYTVEQGGDGYYFEYTWDISNENDRYFEARFSTQVNSNDPDYFNYWFEYDSHGDAEVTRADDDYVFPSRWSDSYEEPEAFSKTDNVYDIISFKLNAPDDISPDSNPVVVVEVFGIHGITLGDPLIPAGDVYSYRPTKGNGFIIRVWWTQEERAYDALQPGEGEIAVEININGSETARVEVTSLSSEYSQKISFGSRTKYILDAGITPLTLLITPGEDEHITGLLVGQDKLTESDYTVNQDGSVEYEWDISNQDNLHFEACFSGQDGGDGEGDGIEVFFPNNVAINGNDVTFSVGDPAVNVTVTVSGEGVSVDGKNRKVIVPRNNLSSVTFTVDDSFILDTMQIVLRANDGFNAELNLKFVSRSTSLATHSGPLPNSVNFEIDVRGSDPGPGPRPPASDVNFVMLEEALANYTFAYGGSNADAIKTAMAKELSQRRIGRREDIGVENCAFGEVLGLTWAQIKELITLSETTSTVDSDINNKPYYDYTINVTDVDDETAGNQGFTVSGKVYVLPTDRDIVIESIKGDDVTYDIVTLAEDEFATTSAYVDFDELDELNIFGNAAMCNTIYSEDEGIRAYHITQEYAGYLETIPLGSRLLISKNINTVTLNYDKSAAAWTFINVNSYTVGADPYHATKATVFYGANQIRFDAVDFPNANGEPTITGIEVLNISDEAISVNDSTHTLTFNTDYDFIALRITYNNGYVGYLDITRVGLTMESTDVSVGPNQDHYTGHYQDYLDEYYAYDDIWGAGTKTFTIWHGTDHTIRYQAESSDEKLVTATFYYDTADEPTAADRVNLYVTIRRTDGTVERMVITDDDAITSSTSRKATAVENGGYIQPEEARGGLGESSQGTCKYYDDFILWSGSASEYQNIETIYAIAFTQGSDENEFGGVKVGSGAGVGWNRPISD